MTHSTQVGETKTMNAKTDTKPKLVSDEEQLARLTRKEEAALDAAIEELAKAKRARNKGSIEIAQAKIDSIAAKPRQRVRVTERRAALDETLKLARDRGEEVNTKPEHGAAEIETRDGLKRMRKLGHLTEEQLRVGLIYRSAHEARGAGLKASQIGDSGGAGHDNDKFVMKGLERAKLSEFVGKTDRAVALGCISNPSALQMLRHVAGEGGNVTDFGKGRALERNREGLSQALDIALRVWRDTVAQHRVSESDRSAAS